MNRWVLCTMAAILCSGVAYGQAPPNDTCAGAIEISCGSVNLNTDTSLANNDYDQLGFCTGFSSGGPDIVYRIVIPNGGSVNLTLTHNDLAYDASLYLITDCSDPSGSCLVGDDQCNVPTESITYTNNTGLSLTTFLIVDGYAEPGGCGAPFGIATLSGTVSCPPATGACCRIDGTCSVVTESECAAVGGTYQGDGTGCTPNPCAQPSGACCRTDGTCFVGTASECQTVGGTYQGDGTDCDPNPCIGPATGACCQPGGACSITTEADCLAQGGFYVGDGTDCDPNPCVTPVEPTTWGRIKSIYK